MIWAPFFLLLQCQDTKETGSYSKNEEPLVKGARSRIIDRAKPECIGNLRPSNTLNGPRTADDNKGCGWSLWLQRVKSEDNLNIGCEFNILQEPISFRTQIRNRSENEFHKLNGLIVQLSAMPEIDNETKFIYQGVSRDVSIYRGEDWLIFYRVHNDNGEEVIVIISIWDADNAPLTRL